MEKIELEEVLIKCSELFNIELIDSASYGHESSCVSICRIGNLFLFISIDPRTTEITMKIGNGYFVKGYANLMEVPLLYREALDVICDEISDETFSELRHRVDNIKNSDDLKFILNNSLSRIIEKSNEIIEREKKVLALYRGQLVPM